MSRQAASDPTMHQKDHHRLPDRSGSQVTDTMESETADKAGGTIV